MTSSLGRRQFPKFLYPLLLIHSAMDAEVIVAGVNVAGSFALKALSGTDVIAIEKRRTLGYPVECGELVPYVEEMKRLLPDLKSYELFEIPGKYSTNETDYIELIIPNGKSFKVPFKSHIIERDRMVQDVASKGDATILTQHLITGYNRKKLDVRDLETKKKLTISGKVIIASDGGHSVIGRHLGLRNELCPTIQYLMDNVETDENVVKMFVGQEVAAGGYAWIIPKGNGLANVGLGFRKEYARKGDTIHKTMDRFLHKLDITKQYFEKAKIIHKVGAVVPIGLPGKTVVDNVLLAGDSGSQIITHVGAGIPTSMVCGNLAGKIASMHVREGIALSKYETEWKTQLMDALMRSYAIKSMWDLVSKDDARMVRMFEKLVTEKDMYHIIRGYLPLKLAVGKLFLPFLKMVI